jgi:hypothetical protein
MVISVIVALGFSALYQGMANLFFRNPQQLAGAMIVQGVGFIIYGYFMTRSWVRGK